MINLSSYVQQLKPSPTLEIMKIADRLKKEGKSLFDFGIGELNPEIKTPPELIQEIVASLKENETHYSPSAGDPELLEALSGDFKSFGLNYSPAQIIICPGPKDAFFKACMAILDPSAKRNRLVAFAPVYESFEQVPIMLTGKPPIIIQTDENFVPDLNQLEDLLKNNPNVAGVVINSPNNPTGTLYPEAFFKELSSLLKKYEEITVLADEVYRTIRYDEKPYTSIAMEIPERTLYLSGISKELSATGLRLGFIAGPPSVMETIETLEGHISSCVNLPTQKGLARFLRKDNDLHIRKGICNKLMARRERVIKFFSELVPNSVFVKPEGAFYFFPDIRYYLGKKTPKGEILEDDGALARYLLEEANVVTIPGSSFLRPNHLRFAYAVSFDTIEGGISKMAEALGKL